MSKQSQYASDIAEAITELRGLLPVGTTVGTILRHVSASGMTRHISPVLVQDGNVRDLTWNVVKAGIAKESARYQGVTLGGAGMDMGFALVYSISRTVYRDGFDCIGEDCPSNDHSNTRPTEGQSWAEARAAGYAPGTHHSDGGYALNQRWI